jgi:hypothetical protein
MAEHHHGHDHHHSDSQLEHKVKHEMIERLHPFYDSHRQSLVERAVSLVFYPFQTKYEAEIDTSNFQSKPFESLSESQKVSRTVFGLKKIKEFNHHFFNDSEQRVLNPLPPSIIPKGMKFGFAALDAAILTYMWRSWNFNPRLVALMAFSVGCQYVTIRMPNIFAEVIQGSRRRGLAKEYIELYGAEFFHDIVNPSFDVEKLRHLHNKLHV